jgi:hypothetical protein
MQTTFIRNIVRAAVLCSVLAFGLNLFAGPSPAGGLLVEAYRTLERADHDYKGHRADAMKQVEEAAKIIGVKVRGDGKGHEKQGVSDEQLHAAQGLLEQARSGLSGRALKHCNKAIEQISIALRIK